MSFCPKDTAEGDTRRQIQHNQAVCVWAGSVWLSALLIQALYLTLCVHPHSKEAFSKSFDFYAYMDQSHAAYFSQEEQVVVMESYEKNIPAKSSRAAEYKARKLQKTADHVSFLVLQIINPGATY